VQRALLGLHLLSSSSVQALDVDRHPPFLKQPFILLVLAPYPIFISETGNVPKIPIWLLRVLHAGRCSLRHYIPCVLDPVEEE
jgi:hypothetical protein